MNGNRLFVSGRIYSDRSTTARRSSSKRVPTLRHHMPLLKVLWIWMVAEIMKVHAFAKDWELLGAFYSTKSRRCQENPCVPEGAPIRWRGERIRLPLEFLNRNRHNEFALCYNKTGKLETRKQGNSFGEVTIVFGDTIAAISTAWGNSGIAIVRLSGPDSWAIAQRQVRLQTEAPLKVRFARNAVLLDESGEVIDHILVLPFRGPRSYTGEDLVELHCHGGSLAAQRCLELLISGGARMALPGEYTRRAFENGRLDLSQAEAVGALIQARSNEALRAANRTLDGELTRAVSEIYEELTSLGAEIEVGLDFPEEDVPYIADESLAGRLEIVRQSLADLLERCSSGVILREGIRIAIVGRPNAGKSSLLNALLKESRAIVTAIPGTTRDVIEAVLTYRGIPLRLVDTAGITENYHDEVEAIGVERARAAMKEADVCVWVIDGSEPLHQEDVDRVHELADTPHLVVLNKADLPQQISEASLTALIPASTVISVSAAKGLRLDELKESLVGLVSGTGALDTGLNASSRQVEELRGAIASVGTGLKALGDGLDQALVSSCVGDARRSLSRILGGDRDEDLLHEIFGRFCIGK